VIGAGWVIVSDMNLTSCSRSEAGFDLMDVLVTVVIVFILIALVPATFVQAKTKVKRNQCVNNLKQTGVAFRLWEYSSNNDFPLCTSTNLGGTKEYAGTTFLHFQVLSNELGTLKILICPSDTRVAAADFLQLKNQNISYFVGLDASERFPQRVLDGDRNITGDREPENGILKLIPGQRANWTRAMHHNRGNLGLSDGSVQPLSNSGLYEALKFSGDPTNTWRLALPE
jgi:hypothetical protein